MAPRGMRLPNQRKGKEHVEKEGTHSAPIARTGESRKQPKVAKDVFPELVGSTADVEIPLCYWEPPRSPN